MDTRPVTHLLDLPDEVLVAILGFLDCAALRQAVLISKRIRDLSEPFLYHDVQVQSGSQVSAFTYSLGAESRRPSFVSRLLVSTKLGEESGVSTLPPFLGQMCNLKSLTLETPDCNLLKPEERVGWVEIQDEYERIFQQSSVLVKDPGQRLLPRLQTCTIHFVDSDWGIYPMTRYSMLFLHPALKSLTISCASTDFPNRLVKRLPNHEDLRRSTQLEHLHLEECDIFPQTLAILLSFPRQLKSLKISEGVRYNNFQSRSNRLHNNVSPELFVQALSQCCVESLERLSLSLGHRIPAGRKISDLDQYLALSGFEQLKHLEVDGGTLSLLRSHPCDHQTWKRMPPNLESLKVFGISIIQRLPFRPVSYSKLPLKECIIRDKAAHGLPKLKLLVFGFQHYRHSEQYQHDEQLMHRVLDLMGAEQDFYYVNLAISALKDECDRYEPVCKKAGVRMQLHSTILPTGFIPPYLFYEAHPTSSIIWQTSF